MRKIVALFSLVVLALSMAGCGKKEPTLGGAVKDAKESVKSGAKEVKDAVDEAKK